GLLGKYPFGGAMRHQVLLLVFGILAALVALDQWICRTSPGGRGVIIGLLLLAVTVNAALNHREWLSPGPDPFASEVRTFRTRFPDARTVDLDQFNLIGFFAQHHDWHWSFLGS